MNAFVLFAIAAALCAVGQAKTCNEVPYNKDVDAIKYLGKYSGKMLRYSSLNNDVCGVGTFDTTKSVYTFTPTNKAIEATSFKIEYKDNKGSGLYVKINLATGKNETRELNDCKEDGPDNTWSCFFTCGGVENKETPSFDCYISSPKYIQDVEAAIAAAGIDGLTINYCEDLKKKD